jgi:hypothetical protein
LAGAGDGFHWINLRKKGMIVKARRKSKVESKKRD